MFAATEHTVRRGPPTRALALCAIGATLALAPAAAASIPQSAVYDIQLQGAVNGLPFTRSGGMAIGPTVTQATTNGVNPIDLCLASGSPFITPERGAIWFATNSVCANANGALLDLAFVAANRAAGTTTIRPDPALSATGVNGFNGSSGYTAAIWQIFDGTMTLRFQGQGQTVTGTLDLLGTGAIFHSENTYKATLSGQATELTPSAPAGDAPAGDVLDDSGCAKAKKKVKKAKRKLRRAKTAKAHGKARRKLRRAKRKKRRACAAGAADGRVLRFDLVD